MSLLGSEKDRDEDVVDQDDIGAKDTTAMKLKDEGNGQLKVGHFLDAIRYYSEALELIPTNAIILSNRAQAYIKVESYGLAMTDATAALKSDPKYAKAYYRRGSAQFALGHLKDARKDFRKVCQLNPKSKDSRIKLQTCEKAIRQEAFLKAIESEMTAPLSASYDPNLISISDSYDGPNPIVSGPLEDMEQENALFIPGKLPREFVLVSFFPFFLFFSFPIHELNCVSFKLTISSPLFLCYLHNRRRWNVSKIKNSFINDMWPEFYSVVKRILNL